MDVEAPELAGRRQWLALAVLALPTILIGMDGTVMHLAAPQLSAELQPTSSQLLWIVDVYGFVVASLLITMGTLGDRIGRRRLLMIGAAGFAAASLIGAFATSATMLIGARALLGLAGATLMPSTLSLISNMFRDPGQRRFAIAVWMTNFMVGGMAGPVIGGLLLERYWWGSVFLIGVPPLLVLLATAPVLLPEYRQVRAGRLDLGSAALSAGAIFSVVYGLKESARQGLEVMPLLAVAVGVIAGWVFVRRQFHLPDPLLDLRLFARAAFSVSLGAQTFGLFVLAAMQFVTVQYFQLVLGLSALETGLWMLPMMLTGIVGTLAGPVLVRWLRAGRTMTAGFAFAVPGLLLMVAYSGRTAAVVGLAITGFGVQLVLALSYDLIIGSAPPERAGIASGMGETGTEFGMALGVAVAGSVVTAVYRNQATAETIPAGVAAAEVAKARETLGNVVGIADQLPAPVARELLDVTQAAYSNGVQTAALINAGVLAVLAVVTATRLKRPKAVEATTEVELELCND